MKHQNADFITLNAGGTHIWYIPPHESPIQHGPWACLRDKPGTEYSKFSGLSHSLQCTAHFPFYSQILI